MSGLHVRKIGGKFMKREIENIETEKINQHFQKIKIKILTTHKTALR